MMREIIFRCLRLGQPRVVLLVLSVALVSCGSVKHHALPASQAAPPASPAGDSILFLGFRLTQGDAAKRPSVQLIGLTRVSGKIKSPAHAWPPLENHLMVYLLAGDRLVDSLPVDHPLYRRVESWQDGQALSAQGVVLTQAECWLRLPLRVNADRVSIVQQLKGKPAETLATLTL